MYFFYFDESGRPSLEDKLLDKDPWFVMTAVGIHSSQWLEIDSDIIGLKKRFFPNLKPINIEFKSINLRSYGSAYPVKPFADLAYNQMGEIVNRLYSIYDRYQLPLFTVVIQKRDHKDKYTIGGKRPEPPYQLAFKMIVERIDYFLDDLNTGKDLSEREFGIAILDEYVGQYKVTRSNLLWYQESGTFAKKTINNIKEVPFFNVSHYSHMLTLPDLVAYNVYHRFRYDKPDYEYYQRIKPYLYRSRKGKLLGYGLKVFPNMKALPD